MRTADKALEIEFQFFERANGSVYAICRCRHCIIIGLAVQWIVNKCASIASTNCIAASGAY